MTASEVAAAVTWASAGWRMILRLLSRGMWLTKRRPERLQPSCPAPTRRFERLTRSRLAPRILVLRGLRAVARGCLVLGASSDRRGGRKILSIFCHPFSGHLIRATASPE